MGFLDVRKHQLLLDVGDAVHAESHVLDLVSFMVALLEHLLKLRGSAKVIVKVGLAILRVRLRLVLSL